MPKKMKTQTKTNKHFNAEPQYRAAEATNIDTENRTFDISFSSETPFERWYGLEVLDHDPKSIRMDRIKSGSAPLLLNHNVSEQIGVVEKAAFNGKRGTATVRLSKNADHILTDIEDGILKNISVGYRVYRAVLEEETKDGPDTYRVTDWEPMEISVVSVPADASVGFGRSSGDGGNPFIIEEIRAAVNDGETIINEDESRAMPAPVTEKSKTPVTPAAGDVTRNGIPAAAPVTVGGTGITVEERQLLLEEERVRTAEITALGRRYNASDMAERSISEGVSVDAFRRQLLDNMPEPTPINTVPRNQRGHDIGLSDNEKRQYSFVRAIHAAASGDNTLASFEHEVSEAARDGNRHKEYRGNFTVPQEILDYKRGMSVNDFASGGALVGTTHDHANFIDLLRSRMLLPTLGARMMNGLVGDVSIPKQTGGSTAFWVTEDSDIPESSVTVGSVLLRPRSVGGHSILSRKLLLQSSPDAERLVREDMAAQLARKIESAAYNGTGADGQPLGILNSIGINQVDYGASVTWADVVAMETAVAEDNADFGNLAYVCTPALCGTMKSTAKEPGQALYIWDKDTINGHSAHASSLVPAGKMIFGNFNDLIIATWSGLDVLVDPYTNSQKGQVRVTAFHEVDVAVRHAQSFCEAYT